MNKIKISLIAMSLILFVSLVSSTEYYPNSTGSSAWRCATTGGAVWGWSDCVATAYSSAELNLVSFGGIGGVSSAMGGAPFSFAKSGHRYVINISETATQVSSITITINQSYVSSGAASCRSLDLYIGNVTGTNWIKLDGKVNPVSATKYIQNGTINYSIADFINQSATGNFVYILMFNNGTFNTGGSLTHIANNVNLTVNVITSSNCWTKTGNVLFIPTGCVYNINSGANIKI